MARTNLKFAFIIYSNEITTSTLASSKFWCCTLLLMAPSLLNITQRQDPLSAAE